MKIINERGITLITLVITIIIMLILSGVVITLALVNNGLIGNAKEAKKETIIAQEKEQIKISYTSGVLNKLNDDITESDLQIQLDTLIRENKTKVATAVNGNLTVKFLDTGHIYEIIDGEVYEKIELGKIKIYATDIVNNSFTLNAELLDSMVEPSYVEWELKSTYNGERKSYRVNFEKGKTSVKINTGNITHGSWQGYAVIRDAKEGFVAEGTMYIHMPYTKVGTLYGQYNGSLNCTTLSNYQSLKTEDFYFDCINLKLPNNNSGTVTLSKNYNPNTGVFSMQRTSLSGSGVITFSGNVYAEENVKKIGSYTGSYNIIIDCSLIEDYKNKTVNDFLLDYKSIRVPESATGTITFSKTYDKEKGKLTISRNKISGPGTISFSLDMYVYK